MPDKVLGDGRKSQQRYRRAFNAFAIARKASIRGNRNGDESCRRDLVLHQARPADVALITNAGAAHVEGLGSVEAVARAKGEIFEGLDQQAELPSSTRMIRTLRYGAALPAIERVMDFGLEGANRERPLSL